MINLIYVLINYVLSFFKRVVKWGLGGGGEVKLIMFINRDFNRGFKLELIIKMIYFRIMSIFFGEK